VVPALGNLKVKLFADGADLAGMREMAAKQHIAGLTTNPTLMRKAGITDYVTFAKSVLAEIPDKPISFEVFSDDFDEIVKQGKKIASWGENVYVKVPIMNTRGEFTDTVIRQLVELGIKVNVTAVMTVRQVKEIAEILDPDIPSYISLFAGRVADTGRDPLPVMTESLRIVREVGGCELIWASPREVFNIYQANLIECDIITATNDILKKLDLAGKDLFEYSLETVKMFHEDAEKSEFTI